MTIPQDISRHDPRLVACNLMAIPTQERARHSRLRLWLTGSLNSAKVLEYGFVFEFHTDAISVDEIAGWIDLERLRCPWISFRALQVARNKVQVLMKMPERAMDAARAEFSDWLMPKR